MSGDELRWPYLKSYFKQLPSTDEQKNGANFIFKCLLCIPKIKLISTSKTSNSNLKNRIKVMKPVATGLDVLQGEKHVCIGYLFPTIVAMNKALDELKNLNYCRPLVHTLKKGLHKRFKNYTQSKTLQVSSTLVSKFKLFWANLEDKNAIKQHLIDRVNFHFDSNRNLSSQSSLSLQTNSEDDDFFSFSNNEISIVNSDFQTLVTDYISNTNIKVPSALTFEFKKTYRI